MKANHMSENIPLQCHSIDESEMRCNYTFSAVSSLQVNIHTLHTHIYMKVYTRMGTEEHLLRVDQSFVAKASTFRNLVEIFVDAVAVRRARAVHVVPPVADSGGGGGISSCQKFMLHAARDTCYQFFIAMRYR